jgi:hypothetical protein
MCLKLLFNVRNNVVVLTTDNSLYWGSSIFDELC